MSFHSLLFVDLIHCTECCPKFSRVLQYAQKISSFYCTGLWPIFRRVILCAQKDVLLLFLSLFWSEYAFVLCVCMFKGNYYTEVRFRLEIVSTCLFPSVLCDFTNILFVFTIFLLSAIIFFIVEYSTIIEICTPVSLSNHWYFSW